MGSFHWIIWSTLLPMLVAIVGPAMAEYSSSSSSSTPSAHNHHNNHHHSSNHRWMRTEVMDRNGLYILDWRVHNKEIYFRITANTRGFVGLGFSLKSGRMAGADLVMAWVDDRTGKPMVLVSRSFEIVRLFYQLRYVIDVVL